jgi:hypothetical protein
LALPLPSFVVLVQSLHPTSTSNSAIPRLWHETRHFHLGHLQGDIVRHSLSLCEVLWLVLGDDMPSDTVVDTVLQQHCLVHRVGAIQVTIAAVCLGCAPNL